MHSIKGIDFWQFLSQLFLVALDKAADGYQPALLAASLLDSHLLKQDVNRLLFGVANESTCVDNDNITVVTLAVEEEFEACLAKVACDMLRIGDILGAAKSDDV